MIFNHPSIDPVIFSVGMLEIRWYSLAYVLSFILGAYLIKIYNTKLNLISNKLIDDFFIWSVIGVIIGGRVGYVLFYQINNFLLNPIYILYIWKGGMSFHGGLLGMILSIFIFSHIHKANFLYLADLVAIVAPIGLFFGRIANFINKELIGRVTDFPLAVTYPKLDNLPRHPSQLYESFFEGLLLFFILILFFYLKYSKKTIGMLSSLFLFFYSIFRFGIEFLREPDSHIGLIFNLLTMGQLLCIPLFFISLIILIIKKNAKQ